MEKTSENEQTEDGKDDISKHIQAIYRNNLSSEKTKNNSNNNIAQSLSSAPSGKSIENFYDKPITDEKIALDSIEVNRDKLGYSDKNKNSLSATVDNNIDWNCKNHNFYNYFIFFKSVQID